MELDPRLHFVAITGIVVKTDSKQPLFLIAKRAANEKAYPNRWTVPGGKLVLSEYGKIPKTTPDAWYNIVEWVLNKEIKEEVGLEVAKPQYLTDMTFVRPDGYPVLVLSYWCHYRAGEVNLCKDLTDYAWVTVEEAKKYDLIEGIWEEIREVGVLLEKKLIL